MKNAIFAANIAKGASMVLGAIGFPIAVLRGVMRIPRALADAIEKIGTQK